MEVRSDKKAELAAVENRLVALSQPMPPRPSKTLIEALASESVPPGVPFRQQPRQLAEVGCDFSLVELQGVAPPRRDMDVWHWRRSLRR